VVRVVDGDLIVLLDRQQMRVRLKEIDAPELKQLFGKRSRQSLTTYASPNGLGSCARDSRGREDRGLPIEGHHHHDVELRSRGNVGLRNQAPDALAARAQATRTAAEMAHQRRR
jgi:hypothetical protein